MKERKLETQKQEHPGIPIDSELLKNPGQVSSLSDHKRDILRWQDDGAPSSWLDDDLI